MALLSTTIFHS
jgi:hypothetical protein